MDHIPVPSLYRTTNNNLLPIINSKWINNNGNIIRVTNICVTAGNPIIIRYKSKDNSWFLKEELSLSLQKFYSLFSSFD